MNIDPVINNTHDEKSSRQLSESQYAWKNIDSVRYYINSKFKFSQTVAIFSFIGTIVKRVRPNSVINELEYLYDKNIILEKLKLISESGASIILYDSLRSEYLDDIKKAIDLFQQDLGHPIVSFISTKINKYSKPFTGIWKIIELLYKRECKAIEKSLSMVIGNKAGRINIKRRRIDKNCADRAFAHNIKINFITPERFFLNNTDLVLWEWEPKLLNKSILKHIVTQMKLVTPPNILDEIFKLPISDKFTIIITGPPSCGKTQLAKKIKSKWGSEYDKNILNDAFDNSITRISDNSEHIQNINSIAANMLMRNQSVIIDMRCYNSHIVNVVKASAEKCAPILIVEIKADPKILYFIDHIRVQKSKSYTDTLLTHIEWKCYYDQYKKPEFNLPCVKYIEFPLIIEEYPEIWYEYSQIY